MGQQHNYKKLLEHVKSNDKKIPLLVPDENNKNITNEKFSNNKEKLTFNKIEQKLLVYREHMQDYALFIQVKLEEVNDFFTVKNYAKQLIEYNKNTIFK